MKPQARKCAKCGKRNGMLMAFVHPTTKKPDYWHVKCFEVVKAKS